MHGLANPMSVIGVKGSKQNHVTHVLSFEFTVLAHNVVVVFLKSHVLNVLEIIHELNENMSQGDEVLSNLKMVFAPFVIVVPFKQWKPSFSLCLFRDQ